MAGIAAAFVGAIGIVGWIYNSVLSYQQDMVIISFLCLLPAVYLFSCAKRIILDELS